MLLKTSGACLTVAIDVLASGTLRTNPDTVTNLDTALSLGTDADSGTDELVADAARVIGWPLHGISVLLLNVSPEGNLPIRCEEYGGQIHRHRSV